MKKSVVMMVFLLVLGAMEAHGAVQGKEVTYKAEGVEFKGYIAWDDSIKGKRPGILVVHEWWGHNDYARMRARMLAELGYTALAVDMYGGGKQATHPGDAGKFSSEVMKNMASATARFEAALALLKKEETTDAKHIAAIGYCFGGGVVLQMARIGLDLDGVVSFHGSYATEMPAKKGTIKASVLVCHGSDDQFVTPEEVKALKKEMAAAGADFRFVSYDGAKHSFTNPEADSYGRKFNIPLAYHEAADSQSWDDMQRFLRRIFAE